MYQNFYHFSVQGCTLMQNFRKQHGSECDSSMTLKAMFIHLRVEKMLEWCAGKFQTTGSLTGIFNIFHLQDQSFLQPNYPYNADYKHCQSNSKISENVNIVFPEASVLVMTFHRFDASENCMLWCILNDVTLYNLTSQRTSPGNKTLFNTVYQVTYTQGQ